MIGTTIKRGDRRKLLVRFIQTLLVDEGYSNILPDGDFGGKTEAAIKDYQAKMKLEQTGIIGQKEMECLLLDTKWNELGLLESNVAKWVPCLCIGSRAPFKVGKREQKSKTMLHHTASGPEGYNVVAYFADEAFATTFVIGADGTIWQLATLDMWAYHINCGGTFKEFTSDQEERLARQTFGVEICNWGYLEKKGDKFYSYTGTEVPADQVIDYVDFYGQEYRGQRYFQKYTEAQVSAVKELLKALREKGYLKIDKVQYDLRWLDYCHDAIRGKRNLMSHSQVRDKTDIHPQPDMLKMLQDLV